MNEAYFSNVKDANELHYGEYEGEDETIWSTDDPVRYLNGGGWDKETTAKIHASRAELNTDSIQGFKDILSSPEMQDIFEAMFGDHVRINLTREGIEVDDYSHD